MNPAAERLRDRIAGALQQGPGGRRYGAELQRAVVEHAFARQGERATIREIAEELSLSAGLLGKWLRHARLRPREGQGAVPARRAFDDGGEPSPMNRIARQKPTPNLGY